MAKLKKIRMKWIKNQALTVYFPQPSIMSLSKWLGPSKSSSSKSFISSSSIWIKFFIMIGYNVLSKIVISSGLLTTCEKSSPPLIKNFRVTPVYSLSSSIGFSVNVDLSSSRVIALSSYWWTLIKCLWRSFSNSWYLYGARTNFCCKPHVA